MASPGRERSNSLPFHDTGEPFPEDLPPRPLAAINHFLVIVKRGRKCFNAPIREQWSKSTRSTAHSLFVTRPNCWSGNC